MNTIETTDAVEEILSALEALSPDERDRIAGWIRELDHRSYRVEEPAKPVYHTEPRFLSVEEYLEFEEQSVIRHEYVGGLVYAMTGSTRRHNAISLNLAAACHRHLGREIPCRAFINDVKVRLRVNQKDIFYYPDVMVACDPGEAKDMEKVWVKEPKLIVEVLSPSTQSIDRREKLQNYSQIDTLEEYVLVAQRTPEVSFYRRDSDWKPVVVRSPEGVAEFQSISLFLPMTRLYANALPV